MQANLKVRRFDPEAKAEPYYQEYSLEVPEYFTVLDSLIQVREYMDGSLALRCSCRSAICGSCAMTINGQARLACKTKVINLAPAGEQITVEPGGNLPVLKDLIVDMKPFWDKVRQVEPYLQPTRAPEPGKEYLVDNAAMLDLAGTMACIMCGACVMACESLAVDKNFIAPAALAKAYRFVGDPRDGASMHRLEELSKYGGVWDCTHCFSCVEVCPKDVAPMNRIMQLRELAVEAGYTGTPGARHAEAFARSVRTAGRLNEVTLVSKSVGLLNLRANLAEIPGALRLLRSGKLYHAVREAFFFRIRSYKSLRRIFQRAEARKREKAQARTEVTL